VVGQVGQHFGRPEALGAVGDGPVDREAHRVRRIGVDRQHDAQLARVGRDGLPGGVGSCGICRQVWRIDGRRIGRCHFLDQEADRVRVFAGPPEDIQRADPVGHVEAVVDRVLKEDGGLEIDAVFVEHVAHDDRLVVNLGERCLALDLAFDPITAENGLFRRRGRLLPAQRHLAVDAVTVKAQRFGQTGLGTGRNALRCLGAVRCLDLVGDFCPVGQLQRAQVVPEQESGRLGEFVVDKAERGDLLTGA